MDVSGFEHYQIQRIPYCLHKEVTSELGHPWKTVGRMTLRSHEVKAQGYRYDHEGALATHVAPWRVNPPMSLLDSEWSYDWYHDIVSM